MSNADETLLREMIGKIEKLSAEMQELRSLLVERRRHTDQIESRLSTVETKVRDLEMSDAKGSVMPGTLKDHEERIRRLENIEKKVMAVAFLGSGIGGFIAWLVGTFL